MRKFGLTLLVLAVAFTANVAMAQNNHPKGGGQNGGPFGAGIEEGAACYTEALTGVVSVDGLGDPDNTVISADVSACGGVTDVGWTGVVISTVGASWGAEVRVQVSASDSSSASTIQFTTATSAGTFGPNTGNLGAGVTLLGDMLLRMEFFETFIDNSNSTDANYQAGQLDVVGVVVPVELQQYSID